MGDDEELELSAYDAAVTEHCLYGLARARMFDELAHGKRWDADLTAGTLRVGTRTYRADILGTFAKRSRTFRWAWANPGASGWEPALGAASELRRLGERGGHAVFEVASVPEGWVHPWELALVAGELLGGHPVHPPDSGQTTVFLVVLGTGIDPRELSLDAFASLLLDFQSFAMVDLSACVARFLARMGFEVTRTEDSTSGWRAQDGAAVTVHWLPSGAIAAITLTSPRAATG